MPSGTDGSGTPLSDPLLSVLRSFPYGLYALNEFHSTSNVFTEVLVYLLFVPSMLAMGFMGVILTRDTWIGGLVWSNR